MVLPIKTERTIAADGGSATHVPEQNQYENGNAQVKMACRTPRQA